MGSTKNGLSWHLKEETSQEFRAILLGNAFTWSLTFLLSTQWNFSEHKFYACPTLLFCVFLNDHAGKELLSQNIFFCYKPFNISFSCNIWQYLSICFFCSFTFARESENSTFFEDFSFVFFCLFFQTVVLQWLITEKLFSGHAPLCATAMVYESCSITCC